MSFDPLAATGLLVYSDPKTREHSLLGTAAMHRRPTRSLTAAHCVRDVPNPRRIRIEFPRLGYFARVTDVHLHPDADLAVLVSPDDELDPRLPPMDPFRLSADDYSLGEEFAAYGYPTEGPVLLVPLTDQRLDCSVATTRGSSSSRTTATRTSLEN